MAFVLVAGLLGQGLSIATMVQYVEHGVTQHQCACAHQGVCPKNPGNPCACDHSGFGDTTADTQSVSTSCHDGQPNKNVVADVQKWIHVRGSDALVAPLSVSSSVHFYLELSPQRLGDEVFHPPRFRTA